MAVQIAKTVQLLLHVMVQSQQSLYQVNSVGDLSKIW